MPLAILPLKKLASKCSSPTSASFWEASKACEQIDRICFAAELEERFVDVGVKRFIEYVGSDEDVYLIREGRKIQYKDLEVG